MLIDESRTVRARPGPAPHHLTFLGSAHAGTDRIEVSSRFLERDGRPWFPITGEIHYSRIPRERWSEVLGHARAGGLDTVATYVFWQAHEPQPGQFCWDGNLDLRAFVELAAEHGLGVVVRMGPWAHGEARHGGFPDWLVERDLPTRTNDPVYLGLVRALYGQIIDQLTGLTLADGGPVVGAQMDNELYDQPEHLATLRRLAEELGLRVPLWTATGWGGAQVPDTLLPVYSAYSDGFWEESSTGWPPFAAFHFRYSAVRDDLTVGADLREALDGIVVGQDGAGAGAPPATDRDALPFATCELGGGMHVAYHRRPLVGAEDVAALALAKIGSGSVWQGYYMYAGGTQRVGPAGPEQESQATGYPNDVPTRTYDFFAPVGEHGQVRRHHHLLRRQHLWLADDGARIAAMAVTVGGGSEDPAELRWSVRSDGASGYLFLTTYQPPAHPLEAQAGVQVTVELDGGPVTVPTRPVDVPAGVSVAWPLRYPLTDDLVLRSATAQVVARLGGGTVSVDEIVVLVATAGIAVELVLDGDVTVGGAGTAVAGDGTTVVALAAAPGPECVVVLPGVRVVVLDDDSADRLYRLEVAGAERLVLSDAPVYAFHGDLVVHADVPEVTLALLPTPRALTVDGRSVDAGGDRGDLWSTWTVPVPGAGHHEIAGETHPEAHAPDPVHGGPMRRLSAPTDYSGAARVHLDVPADLLTGTDRALLRIDWTGDVGRAWVGDELVSDHFWHGRVWDIDLTPWRDEVAEHGVTLELLPWCAATGVRVDPSVEPDADGVTIRSTEVVRVGRVTMCAAAR